MVIVAVRHAALACALALAACEADETATCLDEATIQICADDECQDRFCRGDEVCQAAACLPWAEGALSADFEVVPLDGRRRLFRILPGGFPRAFAESIRFDFGDGMVGHGEEVVHRFREGGVFPVSLEVVLAGRRVLRASRLVEAPPFPPERRALLLTVNDIPPELNGSRPARSDAGTPGDPGDDTDERFTLLLPSHGFTVDVTLLDAAGAAARRDSLVLAADRPLGGGSVAAGQNLAAHLVFPAAPTLRAPKGTWLVPPALAFPDGEVTLRLSATLEDGRSVEDALTFLVTPLTPAIDPFEERLTWLVRFDMDLFTVEGERGFDGSVGLTTSLGANGVADFVEELGHIGAQGGETAPGAATIVSGPHVGANAVYLALVKQRVVEELRRVFLMTPDGRAADGIDLELFADGDPGAPDPLLFDPLGRFSIMRVGGVLADAFGRSRIAYFNAFRVDDSDPDLGVASTTLLGLAAGSLLLGNAFDPVRRGVGRAVGEDERDAIVLSPSFDRHDRALAEPLAERYDQLQRVATLIARTLATVTAHEMGHAMGLMPPGAPPLGFFAGRGDLSVVSRGGTDSAHVNFPGLNVMQAGGNLLGLLGELSETVELPPNLGVQGLFELMTLELRLAPYERAYLQRRLTHRR